jgi:hypothetical protein
MAMAIFGLSFGAKATKSSDPLAELFFRQSWQSFQPFQSLPAISIPSTRSACRSKIINK